MKATFAKFFVSLKSGTILILDLSRKKTICLIGIQIYLFLRT